MTEQKPIRQIVPNTTGAYCLRVFADEVQELSIFAWLVETGDSMVGGEWRTVRHLTTDGTDEENCSGFVDCVVDRGSYDVPQLSTFQTQDAAIAYCRKQLEDTEARRKSAAAERSIGNQTATKTATKPIRKP
jgi:hypothetical protein